MPKLTAIGDSLAMGFSSGAIFNTQDSFPAFIAEALGFSEFRVPVFNDNDNPGGLPFNLEYYTRILSEKYPNGLNPVNTIGAVVRLQRLLDRIEDYWERGQGSKPLEDQKIYHNLSVLTFGIDEPCRLTQGICSRALYGPKDNRVLFHQIPEIPMYRAVKRVLNPCGKKALTEKSACDQLRLLSQESEIENLIIFLGSNNCLGPIIDMEMRYSEDSDLFRFPHKRRANIWLPQHFKRGMDEFMKRISEVRKRNVFIATVPHVTIPPVSRGEGERYEGYYEYYTRPWIWDSVFDPSKDAKLLREQAVQIDEIIDEYNFIIRKKAEENGWFVVDVCDFLDSAAFRRRSGSPGLKWPKKAVEAIKRRPETSYLINSENSVSLDTRYLRVDEKDKTRLRAGGLFSLDGVHPTNICYGLIADLFLKKMKEAGVRSEGGEEPDLNWDRVVASDTLVTDPPPILSDLRSFLKLISGKITGRLMLRLLESFKSSVN